MAAGGVLDGSACRSLITQFLTVAPQYVPSLQLFALICGLAVWGGEQNATLAVFMYKTVFLIYNKVWIFVTPYTSGFFQALLFFVCFWWGWWSVSIPGSASSGDVQPWIATAARSSVLWSFQPVRDVCELSVPCWWCWAALGRTGRWEGGVVPCVVGEQSCPFQLKGLLGRKVCLQEENRPKIKDLTFLPLELPKALCCSPVLFAKAEQFYSQILFWMSGQITVIADSPALKSNQSTVAEWVSFIFLSRGKCMHDSLTCIILNPFSIVELFFLPPLSPPPFSGCLVAALFWNCKLPLLGSQLGCSIIAFGFYTSVLMRLCVCVCM